jgi:uncharacterized protein (UPF0332 family)
MGPQYTMAMWDRAVATIGAAKKMLSHHPDTAANRAYYAAFYAVSALFSIEEKYFKKHAGLRGAVHKELVHTGRWTQELGIDYDRLLVLRDIADYGVMKNATFEEAREALERAERIIQAVHDENSDLFKLPGEQGGLDYA